MRKLKLSLLVAAVIAIGVFATPPDMASAGHAFQYVDNQAYSSGNWIWWRTGYDWEHPLPSYFRGYGAEGGTPAAGGTFDKLSVNAWAGSSCDNGATWPWSGSGSASATNSNFLSVYSDHVYMPACNGNPYYRVSTSHYWKDGAWSDVRSHTWNQQ